MKIYVSAAMPIEDYRKNHPEVESDELFNQLLDLDPTLDRAHQRTGKYTDWIFLRNKDKTLVPDEFHTVKDALKNFKENSRRYTYQDLGRYKSVREFLDDVDRVNNTPLTEEEKAKALKKAAHQAGKTHEENEHVRFLAKCGDWELWQPKTYEGDISLARKGGAKAGWCTAWEGENNQFKNYTQTRSDAGPLYVFINTTDPEQKYQLHFGSKQFCNFSNSNQGMAGFEKFVADKKPFQDALDFHIIDGCTIQAGNLIGIDNNSEVVDLSNLPLKLSEINPALFHNKSRMRELILPEGITSIPEECFSGCTSLESITMPNTIKTIGDGAFMCCSKLTSIILPDSVTVIGKNCFCYCKSLQDIQLSNSLTTIEKNAFSTCIGLTNIQFPETLQSIGQAAFVNCRGLTSIKLPKSLTTLGSQAFLSCRALVDVQLPKSLENVGNFVFKGCTSLSKESLSIIRKVSDYLGAHML